MMDFTNDEMNLMCIYGTGASRTRLIEKLLEMKGYLAEDETELMELADSAIDKLKKLTDAEFDQLELVPDFDV